MKITKRLHADAPQELEGMQVCGPVSPYDFTQKGCVSDLRCFLLIAFKPKQMEKHVLQVFLRSEKFNQPIFGSNNLSGNVFAVR